MRWKETYLVTPQQLRNGRPIFYSFGDFVFQNNVVPLVPPDFCKQYCVTLDSDAKTAFNVRSKGGKVGLLAFRENFLSVVPQLSFEKGALVKLEMLPFELHWMQVWSVTGLPRTADSETSGVILAALMRTSVEFGTQFSPRKDGVVEVVLPPGEVGVFWFGVVQILSGGGWALN